MAKTIKNETVKSPITGDPLPKETDRQGKTTEEWTMIDLMLTAVGQSATQTVEQMLDSSRVYDKLKEQEHKSEIVLEDADFAHVKKVCSKFVPFLNKGTLFVNFYKALEAADVDVVKTKEAKE